MKPYEITEGIEELKQLIRSDAEQAKKEIAMLRERNAALVFSEQAIRVEANSLRAQLESMEKKVDLAEDKWLKLWDAADVSSKLRYHAAQTSPRLA